MRTSNKRIYACGDVTGIMPFTHVAEYQAGVVIGNALFGVPRKVDYHAVPWVIFTDPEFARVGKNETQARADGLKIDTTQFEFQNIDRAKAEDGREGFVKLTLHKGRVIGASLLGPGAGELVHELALAVAKGLKASDLSNVVHALPDPGRDQPPRRQRLSRAEIIQPHSQAAGRLDHIDGFLKKELIMHKMMPLLQKTDFPAIRRGKLETLQINVGYKCNQACFHCHVNASPKRKEMMSRETLETVLAFVKVSTVETVDITGGAPELNPHFRELVTRVRGMGLRVIDRCNLTILEEPGFDNLPAFLAEHGVTITASLPCYLEENVNQQRGDGVYAASIRALKKLNALGYGKPDTHLELNLVYNPIGPQLPPAQDALQAAYRRELASRHGIEFNQLFTLANMPIARFGSTLVSKGQFHDYMTLLRGSHSDDNLAGVMCRNLISVDYRGYVYDCDFNQMLGIPLRPVASSSDSQRPLTHLRDLINHDLEGNPIMVADHCYGCTAGQGSSCGGALQ